MDLSIQLTPYTITGSPQPQAGHFSKIFTYRPPDENLHQARGELFALIFLSTPDPALDLETLAREAWNRLQMEYFTLEAGSPPSALQEALQKTFSWVKSLIISPQSGQEKILDFNLLTFVVWGNTFYGTRLGENQLYLWRHQGLQGLLEDGLGSGEILENDLFILSTPAVFRQLGEGGICQILTSESLEEAAAILKEETLQKENPAAYALLLLEIKQSLVPSEEEIIEIVDVDSQENRFSQSLKEKLGFLGKVPIKIPSTLSLILNNLFAKKALLRLSLLRKLKIDSRELYVKRPEEQRGGKKFLILAGLSLLFLASVFITRWYRTREEKIKSAENLLSLAEQKIAESKELTTLNPEKAKKLLQEASNELGKVKGMNIKAQSLEEEVIKISEENYKIEKLSSTTATEEWPKETYQLDSQKGVLGSSGKVLLEKSSDWQKIVAVEEYFGNLYLLDVGANQIHKYLGLPQGFSKRFDYFKAAVDLSGALDFAIDANIYILFTGGRVQRYLGGERVEFGLSGFYPPLESVLGIFTSEDNNLLYLFNGNQILIFDKDGNYQKTLEFNLPETDSITNIFINESEKTIWLKNSNSQIFTASY